MGRLSNGKLVILPKFVPEINEEVLVVISNKYYDDKKRIILKYIGEDNNPWMFHEYIPECQYLPFYWEVTHWCNLLTMP